jgi:outer membrane protein, multidrug efflux system
MNDIKIAGLLSVLLMTGCSVFPQYVKPEIKTPETWQATLSHSGKLVALENWWSQFNDPALNQLIDAAQADSPTLDIAVANIKSARANVTTALAQGLPSLTGNASATRSKSGSSVSNNSSSAVSSVSGSLDATWEIDLFGGIGFSKQAAQARLEANETNWHDARVSLAAEVATNYVSYRACQMNVSSYQKALDS